MTGGFKIIIFILIAIVGLFFLGNHLVAIKAVPSLTEFLASTTAQTTDTASSTLTNISSTTPNSIVASTSIPAITPKTNQTLGKITLKFPKGQILAEIASTPEQQAQGLSNRKVLDPNSGMLFVFPSPGSYGFWMKDMNFPLDIVWIDADKKVVSINENISPKTYPEVFVPPKQVLYVLEINAGSAKKFGLKEGILIPMAL